MHVHERNAEKKRLNGLMLKSPMKVYRAYGEIGKEVFADGALSWATAGLASAEA